MDDKYCYWNLLLYLVKPRYLLMSIAIVIIVTSFGARFSGEVLLSSGTQCVVQRSYAS